MKKIILCLFCALLVCSLKAQSLIGAWESYSVAENGDSLRSVVIFADGFQVITTYEAQTGRFISTNGGSWQLEGDQMTEVVEFDTQKPERVGSEVRFQIRISKDEIQIVGSDSKFRRIDNGQPGKLQGAWLMSGRVRDGKTSMRDTNRPRKTMKILSGTRFQWIAYNTETREFKGTGGGTYSTIDGKYTENIEFFSRDDNKAGLILAFNFELIEGTWHHTGLSSKGDPIHEIWSPRQKQ
ncbi:MAG: membrane or secreted protein [Bacteroidota bacterium]